MWKTLVEMQGFFLCAGSTVFYRKANKKQQKAKKNLQEKKISYNIAKR